MVLYRWRLFTIIHYSFCQRKRLVIMSSVGDKTYCDNKSALCLKVSNITRGNCQPCTGAGPSRLGHQFAYTTASEWAACSSRSVFIRFVPLTELAEFTSFLSQFFALRLSTFVVVVYSTPFEGWGHGGRPWSPKSRATLQGLDQRS